MNYRDELNGLPAKTLFERFLIWLLELPDTPDERMLRFEQARRLKLRNDLQEERINRRRALNTQYRLVATWRHQHRHRTMNTKDWKEVTSVFYLEESGTMRRVRAGPMLSRGEGVGVIKGATLGSFEESRLIWTDRIKPWLDGSIGKDGLKCSEITVVGRK